MLLPEGKLAGSFVGFVGNAGCFEKGENFFFLLMVGQPFDFIFLDEPISHLDNDNSAIMSRLLMEEAGKQGAGIIVTSIGKHLELEYDETFRL